ncbi:MAG: hypothetical protein D6701_10785 [Gemmatimonadetes bacterium]|nr:MAG: hypothetical protein D6701_10785 [Gemmatimonadota bacterium]
MSDDKDRSSGGQGPPRGSADALGHGFVIAAAAGLFGWLGYELGSRVGGREVLMLLGLLVGAAAGFYRLYVHVVILPRESDEDRHE